ncbi:MAG TPA: hypothetical protein VEO95_05850 [Chthoniobacteraceae bacterium]|nr:hypothetical protein [Chthoniobacteraceae bacterium]
MLTLLAILGGCYVLMLAFMIVSFSTAPEGFEDAGGFHYQRSAAALPHASTAPAAAPPVGRARLQVLHRHRRIRWEVLHRRRAVEAHSHGH